MFLFIFLFILSKISCTKQLKMKNYTNTIHKYQWNSRKKILSAFYLPSTFRDTDLERTIRKLFFPYPVSNIPNSLTILALGAVRSILKMVREGEFSVSRRFSRLF